MDWSKSREYGVRWCFGSGSRKKQAGASASRKIEGVMGYGHISPKLKGKGFSACVTPANLYGLVTMAVAGKNPETASLRV